MKIVIASGIYPPDVGGPAIYSQSIAREFKEQKNKVAVICYSDRKSIETVEMVEVVRISRKHNKLIRYLLYFWKLLKLARNSDIIYAQGPINSGLPAVLVNKILKKKVILRLGGDYIWEKATDQKKNNCLTLHRYYKFGMFKKQGFILKIFMFVLKSVDLIIFSTEFQRDIYLKYLKLDKKKMVIIKNAFSDFKKSFKKIIRSNEILFAGRITRLKNLGFLINVFSEILSMNNKSIHLILIGDADESEKKKLQELIRELDLEKRVIFKNRISHQELLEKIQRCYFAVLPSLTEISPNFVLDCIKLNKPILCTREVGFYEDFKNDLVFFNPCSREDFLEKLKWLLREKNYKSYQQKMKKIKIGRSWSRLAKEHLLIFKKLK